MPVPDWLRIISTSVVPAALISASALLCLAVYNRLAAVVSRLRGFQRERLEEMEEYAEHIRTGHENASSIRHHQRVMEMLEVQTVRVYRRARMVRLSLLCLLGAIASLTICSLSSGLALVRPAAGQWAGMVAQICFVAGMCMLLAGALSAFAEVWVALEPVQLESEFVTRLSRELGDELRNGDSAEGASAPN